MTQTRFTPAPAVALATSGCFAPIDMQFDNAEAQTAETMAIGVSSSDDWLGTSKNAAGAVYLITYICGSERYRHEKSIETGAEANDGKHHYAVKIPRDLARLSDSAALSDASVRSGWPIAAVEANGACMRVELPGYFGFRSQTLKTPQVEALLR